eukprot:NP_508628.2 Uncharacterized protein CELE_R11G1.2 [Caenorhabditis elegans]
MDDALKEAVNDHFEGITTEFQENRSIISVLHQTVMEGAGLMYPSNYDFEDENENTGEEAKHNAEIQRQKKEKDIEIAEEVVEKATVKSVVLLMDSDEYCGLSIENVYTRYITSETIDQSDTFGYNVPKPIGYKGDEPIWPRSYGYSAEMFFDENGAAFPVHPRKKLGSIIRPLQQGVQKYDDDDKESNENMYDERKALREFYRRFKARARRS